MPSKKRLSKKDRELRQRLARNIVRLRDERGWTQEEAADKAGIHDKHLQKIEYGTVNLTWSTVAKLCSGFRVDIAELVRP